MTEKCILCMLSLVISILVIAKSLITPNQSGLSHCQNVEDLCRHCLQCFLSSFMFFSLLIISLIASAANLRWRKTQFQLFVCPVHPVHVQILTIKLLKLELPTTKNYNIYTSN